MSKKSRLKLYFGLTAIITQLGMENDALRKQLADKESQIEKFSRNKRLMDSGLAEEEIGRFAEIGLAVSTMCQQTSLRRIGDEEWQGYDGAYNFSWTEVKPTILEALRAIDLGRIHKAPGVEHE
jgi:hypothetical protein